MILTDDMLEFGKALDSGQNLYRMFEAALVSGPQIATEWGQFPDLFYAATTCNRRLRLESRETITDARADVAQYRAYNPHADVCVERFVARRDRNGSVVASFGTVVG